MKYSQILVGIVLCILLEFIVYNVNHKYHFFKPLFEPTISFPKTSSISEKREGGGQFTNPLLECVNNEEEGLTNPLNLSKVQLNTFVNKILQNKKVSVLSVYVRDLNNGPWVGVNEQEKFIGGSLLKVPLLISYLKSAEKDPSILEKKIKYEKVLADNTQYFKSKEIEVGKTYTIEELLQYMIYYSDNNAAELLAVNLGTKNFDSVFESLGFGDPDINQPYPVDTITYSGFFRVLFNASYLDKEYSEKALGILSHSEFNQGLKALLPSNVVVSHKFGIRTEGQTNQLHDCGIIYYPKHPYILCVMSRGGEFDDLASAIAQISKFVYDQTDAHIKGTGGN